MIRYAVNLNPIAPVRADLGDTQNGSRERNEMVTQLLFGDFCEITDFSEGFAKIKNHDDGYWGWVDAKMLTEISEQEHKAMAEAPVFRTNAPVVNAFRMGNKTVLHLSAGSRIPFYNHETSRFEVGGKAYQIHSDFVTYLPDKRVENIIPSANIFTNTPYLWGGKNILGIDCSGLVQVAASLAGYTLPRDASMQVNEGVAVSGIEQAQPADLMFFCKAERITHVGIYLGERRIIHASGQVRIDSVDGNGIFNEAASEYTHTLAAIRRL
ncbi:cell wall-associated NlpC family hydrolase [Dysgonomonas sp. PH5-45]|uniref:C40 family peptidase n=1 Tax=unclassified Dysgonomonas TaxID=2630389 RepID=UPI0024758250|nr:MULTISPECIES: C40 family peptidase [unclassified Dysgonomonas]MDH6354565.1 cell wall-associated NlpC family hydrolase [Dysgonomonas sp. PH5-45]MDH6387379.1 cell wall-associated NlpC family hydrolase [Dysgonomonas sp. PH5-37]